ncbi:Chaperone DnaJ-domain superfamily protein [Abeliophyllum distichum]|uniref:Chaperone DnaJ-domain superfamily protein n=1 Tax=Abeliophyllum distichum TaxID=126358 RepID=A0ABD1UHE6_9LAMI
MDESWRMRMRMPTAETETTVVPNLPRRRSTEENSHSRKPISDNTLLDPEDFNDVFGGPPRTILSHHFSGCTEFSRSFSSTGFFYEDIFRPPEKFGSVSGRSGRSLPEFRIPVSRGGQQRRSDHNHNHNHNQYGVHLGFYNDIFGCNDEKVVRSRTRSKTSSSSVLSSEDLSPLRPAFCVDGDNDVSFFASKLRPINVGSRWTSTRKVPEHYQRQMSVPIFSGNQLMCSTENDYNENFRSSPFRFCRKNSSPETLEPISNTSIRVSTEDTELNSPSSVVSTVCEEPKDKANEMFQQHETDQEEDEDTRSYVIEINFDHREGTCEAIGVDEAIAWAKEKFQTHCSENNSSTQDQVKEPSAEEMIDEHRLEEEQMDGHGSTKGPPVEMEAQLVDENIRLWSTGKEADIQILWPDSGWLAIPISNLIKSCQVKKAYQRAQLCLHPDKLQQRGATIPQKYVAEKAFSVLQDAWAAFISQDVPSSKNYG